MTAEYQIEQLNLQIAENNERMAKRKRDKLYTDYSEALEPIVNLQNLINKLAVDAFDNYKKYGALEGLTAQVFFNTDPTNIVQSYKDANRSLPNLRWTPMPIKAAYFSATQKKAESSGNIALPAVIGAIIPGIDFQDISTIDSKSDFPHDKSTFSPNTGKLAFGNVSGQVTLGLTGACVFFNDVNKPIPNTDINHVAANLVLNVNYIYELLAHRSYQASFNMYNFYQRIESQTQHGGWFSSYSVHSIVEDHNASDWFSIKIDNDPVTGAAYTREEQDQIAEEERASLADRALKMFAAPTPGSTPPDLRVPIGSMGSIYGITTWSACPFYYCQFGGFVIGILNSIYGNSYAASEFQTKTNIWARDEVNGAIVVERANRMTFN
jgi:hypothetical protein